VARTVPQKICVRCKISKPATPAYFVPNRPHKNGRPDLPRGSHDICKACESAAMKEAWKIRNQKTADYQQHKLEEDMKKLARNCDP
jgi:hypothetical protein